ncbi:MAG: 3-isopropylmalate dehydratase large subunit [Flavobacteriaceae bacterium]|nr:3-isopropylmalate dehydratase large subunit [Flavobacteriaceae bacterium]
MGKTLFDKVWDSHVVTTIKEGPQVLYIDKHLIHEVTSPQAFNELKERGLSLLRPNQILATADHNTPTKEQHLPIKDELSRKQLEALTKNCADNNIELYGLGHKYNGIIHVIAPELGVTQPGMTIVCGDSHTSTHGAFGSIAFGIGTSQVAQVFATQSVVMEKPKSMRITIDGKLNKGVLSKDVVLYILAEISTNGGTGHFIEFAGEVFENMSMESRMTVCNMSIEMGARGGMIAPDETTFDYVRGRKFAPKETVIEQKVAFWKTLATDKTAVFDTEYTFKASDIAPMITFGTNPGMGMKITASIPKNTNESYKKSLKYMGFKQGDSLENVQVNYVFIGSCTNARIEDFRAAAAFIKGKKKADNVTALIVPGSQLVAKQIREEGLQAVFEDAGFELRQPGCSACLAMNDDKIPDGEYCVSTSNRNFEGRQGQGARTLLASPLVAASVAVAGKIVDISNLV